MKLVKEMSCWMLMGLAIVNICLSEASLATDETLDQRIARGDPYAFLEAADANRKDLIPALERFSSDSTAKKALAKLGVQKYLDEIVAELTTTNSPAFQNEYKLEMEGGSSPARATYIARRNIRERAFGKLAYVNDPSTIRTIAAFLYNTEDPNLDPGNGDAVYLTPAQLAVETLRKMVKNPPQNNDITTWQQWWAQNKDKYL